MNCPLVKGYIESYKVNVMEECEHTPSRQVYSLKPGFFNDGAWYVLTSASLGGRHLSPEEMVAALQSRDSNSVRGFLEKGICLPLHFDGDCALDQVHIIVGDLNPREEDEWLGRIQARLEIPCGEFVLIGGGGTEDEWEAAAQEGESEECDNVTKIKVMPGNYLAEVYAFVNSMTFNVSWDGGYGINTTGKETAETLSAWWASTRPGEPYPQWIEAKRANRFCNADELGLVEYLIRLRPWREEDNALPLPLQIPDVHWCGLFEYRRNIPCPRGLRKDEHLGGPHETDFAEQEVQPKRKYVKIIATPPGEAPQKVREAWVGLILPIIGDGPRERLGHGVISGAPKSIWGLIFNLMTRRVRRMEGYVIDAKEAVDLLEKKSPDAAAWWRTNVPRLIQTGQCLIFDADVCEEVNEADNGFAPIRSPHPRHVAAKSLASGISFKWILIVLVLLMIPVPLILAIRFLPWWALVLLPLVFFATLYLLRRKFVELLFSIPFRMKGRVLKGAEVLVNSIRQIPPPSNKYRDESEGAASQSMGADRDFYELEVVIFPKRSAGQFQFWEPDELRLESPRPLRSSDPDACELIELQVVADPTLNEKRIELLRVESQPKPQALLDAQPTTEAAGYAMDNRMEDGVPEGRDNETDRDDDGNKFFGAQRLKIKVGIRRSVRKLIFKYYFERFGVVMIP